MSKPLPEIKGCPFANCKGEGELHKEDYGQEYSVECGECFMVVGPYRKTKLGAINGWNKRRA